MRLFFTVLLLYPMIITTKLYPASSLSMNNDNNITIYRNMLSTLDRMKDKENLQISLQKALLKRLIAINQSHIPMSSDPVAQLLRVEPQSIDNLREYIEGIVEGINHKWSLGEEIKKRESDIKELSKVLSKDINGSGENIKTLKLQYIYNRKILQRLTKKHEAVSEALNEVPDKIVSAIDKIRFDKSALERDIQRTEIEILSLKKRKKDLQLEKERLDILGYSGKEMDGVIQKLSSIEKQIKSLKKRKLEDIGLLYNLALKEKSDTAFQYQKEIEKMLISLDYPPQVIKHIDELFLKVNTKRFGITKMLQHAADEEFRHSLNLFWEKINSPVITVGDTKLSIFKITGALIILIFGYLTGWIYKRSISNINSHNLTTATRTLLSNMGYYIIVVISFFWMLHYLGIRLTSLAIVAGALSVGIGFGLQNIVSNFVSGIILMFERSIKIGDYIEMQDGLSGYVSDIRMRSVTITTNSNIDIIVPNQQLIQDRVVNWTMHDKIRRFEIPFSVAYGTNVEDVIRVVMEAVGRSGFQDIYTSNERKAQVIMTEMGDSGVNFKLFVWIKGNKTLWPQRTTSRFLILIYTALNEAGIEIPFPQRDLHIRSIDTAIPVVLENKNGINIHRNRR